jgi:hypothetical protein
MVAFGFVGLAAAAAAAARHSCVLVAAPVSAANFVAQDCLYWQ